MTQKYLHLSVLPFLFITLMIGVIPPAMAGLEGPTVDAISYYNKAVDAAENGSTDEALYLINESLAIQPDFSLALITKAGLLIDKSRYDEAEAIINRLEPKNPDDPYILSTKASIYVNTGRFNEAIKEADKVLVKDPTLVNAWILLGTAYGGLGRYDDEINASEKALNLDPQNQKAQSNLDFAREAISHQKSTTYQGDAGKKTPFPGYVVLEAFLVCAFLLLLWKKQ